MPSKTVVFEVGEKYHVFNRGVDKRTIFHNVEDYLRFYESLFWFNVEKPVSDLARAKANSSPPLADRLVAIHAYALVGNHYHIILEQLLDNGISEFIKRVAAGYTGYYNEKYRRSGVLFQGKFKRVLIATDVQYNYLTAYVNENHIVHGLPEPQNIYESSSLHATGTCTSKLIPRPLVQKYNKREAVALAKQIFNDRKVELFDD
jgi:putative transposase